MRIERVLAALTLVMAGRAMTLAFVFDAGGPSAGDPPAAWLMPLMGDAVIGVTAPVVAYLVVRGRGLAVWTSIVGWNVAGLWDALSAFSVHISVPWPEFFMIRALGSSMFFAAAAMHAVMIGLASRASFRRSLGLEFSDGGADAAAA